MVTQKEHDPNLQKDLAFQVYSRIFQSDYVTVECDGKDITNKLKEHRVHSVLFANIPSFGSGKSQTESVSFKIRK